MKHYYVAAAIIVHEDDILCMQRPQSDHAYLSYKYEFPGGKIEKGETVEAALARELKEEMALEVRVNPEDFFLTVNHHYPDFSVDLHSYIVKVASKDFQRLEHEDHHWLKAESLTKLEWAAADLPIVEKLMLS